MDAKAIGIIAILARDVLRLNVCGRQTAIRRSVAINVNSKTENPTDKSSRGRWGMSASDLHVSETCTLGAEHCVCMTPRSLCLYDTPFIVFVWHSVIVFICSVV